MYFICILLSFKLNGYSRAGRTLFRLMKKHPGLIAVILLTDACFLSYGYLAFQTLA